MPEVDRLSIPQVPADPSGDQLPDQAQLALIQWVFDIQEAGYGQKSREAVAGVQQEHGIPVDPDVMIGPRTWSLILELFRQKAGEGTAWSTPASPYRLDGPTAQEKAMNELIFRLNTQLVPQAAAYYVRNKRIADLKQAGNAPSTEVAAPSASEPEVAELSAQLQWNQAKVNQLWTRANQIGIDPRMMLAVLFQEGTGSFNTNAAVPAQFWDGAGYIAGGSGPQPDFEADLGSALDNHILSKVRAYGYYATAFGAAATESGLGDGNAFQFVNWNTVAVRGDRFEVRPGCYATHTEWWKGLQYYFDTLCGDGATHAYSQYLAVKPAPVNAPAPSIRFELTDNGTGPTEPETNWPWIEAFPD